MSEVIYVGIFVDEWAVNLLQSKTVQLAKEVQNVHCTLCFRPTHEQLEQFSYVQGQGVLLDVVGVGCDGHNSGVAVRVPKWVPNINDAQPHITVWLSEDGKAVDTGKLEFNSCERFVITGRVGFYTKGEVDYGI